MITRNKKQETRNKKQETRNDNDLLFTGQGNCIREENGYINHDYGQRLQGIRQLQGKRSNYFTVLMDRRTIFKITDIACVITAREYKGFGMIVQNGIIVREE